MANDYLIKSSVIIPVYNTKEYLDECIQSVLNQTQKEFEIILVDDGSTDGSSEMIDEYHEKYDNVIAIHQTNQKLGAARNAGIKAARGKYVYCMDSDDYIKSDLLEKCYKYAEEKKADFVFFDSYAFWEEQGEKKIEEITVYDRSKVGIIDKLYTGIEYWEQYYSKHGVISGAPFNYIRKAFLEENELMFEAGVFYEDNDWIARMYIHGKRIYYIPEQLYYRRYRPGSIMQSAYSEIHLRSAFFMFWKLLKLSVTESVKQNKQIYEDILWNMSIFIKRIVEETEGFLEEKKMFLKSLLDSKEKLESLTYSRYIEMLFFIVNISKKLFLQAADEERINVVKSNIFDYMETNYRLNQRINVGICGIGKRCSELFDWYERNCISIRANIIFLAQEPTISQYRNYPVCSYERVKNYEYDHVIIASTKYADEISEKLVECNIKSRSVGTILSVLSYF